MVKRYGAWLLVLAALLVSFACGGSSSNPAKPPTPRPTSTLRPASGPNIQIEPRSGPAGTPVTVVGKGWPANVSISLTADVDKDAVAKPYATVTTSADGSFSASFRLEATPDGQDLKVGRFDLIARAASGDAKAMFLVETKRPVGGPVVVG